MTHGDVSGKAYIPRGNVLRISSMPALWFAEVKRSWSPCSTETTLLVIETNIAEFRLFYIRFLKGHSPFLVTKLTIRFLLSICETKCTQSLYSEHRQATEITAPLEGKLELMELMCRRTIGIVGSMWPLALSQAAKALHAEPSRGHQCIPSTLSSPKCYFLLFGFGDPQNAKD